MTGERWLVQQLRAHVLAFVPTSGTTLATHLDGRLHVSQAPHVTIDEAVYPYIVLRLRHTQSPLDGGYRQQWQAEWIVYDRPRSQHWRASEIADALEEALTRLTIATAETLVFLQPNALTRDTLPVPPTPMDRELVQIRLAHPLIAWPAYLTTHAM